MAVVPTMNNEDTTIINLSVNNNNNNDENINNTNKQQQEEIEEDEHEHDMVMPGFRFHPTEEELVEFYLRRKVEGKKFNVELITFLDLYRYDPWELPALAAIGEKEWFFYVPRDRKYRNGDRPNRVTTSGYWKATGADRMIRAENFRPIGLKKTLVFYSGKAPKGIRTSWIMNEYRLPQHETERFQKAEISLCRVYKRAGVEDHPSLPWGGPLSNKKHHRNQQQPQPQPQPPSQLPIIDTRNLSETTTDASSSTEVGTALGLSQHHHSSYISPNIELPPSTPQTTTTTTTTTNFFPINSSAFFTYPTSNTTNTSQSTIDELQRLVTYHHHHQSNQLLLPTTLPHHPHNLINNNTLPSPNSLPLFTTLLQQHHPSSSSSSSTSSLLSPLLNTMMPAPGSSSSLSSSSSSSLLHHQHRQPAASPIVFHDRLWDWTSINTHQQDPTRHDFNPSHNFK